MLGRTRQGPEPWLIFDGAELELYDMHMHTAKAKV
jgi:hypothetical protein